MKKETENKREIADAILLLDKMDNDNKNLNLGYFDGWLKPITKDILYIKQHPEFKDLTDDLLLYGEQELLNFINSKDEAFRLSLLKYINGISNYYFVEEDRHKCELYRDLYNKCKKATPPELKSTNTPHPKLIKTLSTIQQKNLFDMLIDNELLSSETDFDSFCFVFGSYLMPNDFRPLKWLKNRQLLRELITELKHPDAIMRTTKYTLPLYFIDKNDKPITELPTNTPKDLKIEHYLNNLAKI